MEQKTFGCAEPQQGAHPPLQAEPALASRGCARGSMQCAKRRHAGRPPAAAVTREANATSRALRFRRYIYFTSVARRETAGWRGVCQVEPRHSPWPAGGLAPHGQLRVQVLKTTAPSWSGAHAARRGARSRPPAAHPLHRVRCDRVPSREHDRPRAVQAIQRRHVRLPQAEHAQVRRLPLRADGLGQRHVALLHAPAQQAGRGAGGGARGGGGRRQRGVPKERTEPWSAGCRPQQRCPSRRRRRPARGAGGRGAARPPAAQVCAGLRGVLPSLWAGFWHSGVALQAGCSGRVLRPGAQAGFGFRRA